MTGIRVLYFAVLRERLGRDEEWVSLPAGATVEELFAALAAKEPFLAVVRGRVQVAVNQQMVPFTHVLADGDEVALLPPVAGGSDERNLGEARNGVWARIAIRPTSLVAAELEAAVAGPDMGALVSFAGVARRHGTLPEVVALDYEAYVPMAEAVLTAIADELERAHAGCRIAIHHRIGRVAIGEPAVLIVAAAPRRATAFDACRAAIEALKVRAPIWKKELAPDGATWVGFGP